MKNLLAYMSVVLFSTLASAEGPVPPSKVEFSPLYYGNNLPYTNVAVQGEAAKALYERLEVPAKGTSMNNLQKQKIGQNISCAAGDPNYPPNPDKAWYNCLISIDTVGKAVDLVDAGTAAKAPTGLLRVEGEPARGEGTNFYYIPCKTNDGAHALFMSCDADKTQPAGLNRDVPVAPGVYHLALSFSDAWVTVKANQTTTVRLVNVNVPPLGGATTLMAFSDLTVAEMQERWLRRALTVKGLWYGSGLCETRKMERLCANAILSNDLGSLLNKLAGDGKVKFSADGTFDSLDDDDPSADPTVANHANGGVSLPAGATVAVFAGTYGFSWVDPQSGKPQILTGVKAELPGDLSR